MFPGEPPLQLGLALTGLTQDRSRSSGDGLRASIAWAAETGFRAVSLDATAPGLRARDLNRSARRDLAATVRRAELASSGVDLFLPPDHLRDPAHADRAIAAAIGAIGLAADLAALTEGHAVVAMVFPPASSDASDAGWRDALVAEAQRVGARIADCAWPASGHADPASPIGLGIDPAAVVARGDDPSVAVSRAGAMLAQVRVSDWNGVMRVAFGRGRVDVLGLRVAIHTGGAPGFAVVDARGTPDPRVAAIEAVAQLGPPRPDAATP